MHILLVASSDLPSTLDEACGLATVAVDRGHQLTVFFHMGAVGLLKASQAADHFALLIQSGVRLLACRTSAKECGIESEADMIEGAEMSSLSELVEMLDSCDRTLFLG